jgi:hypothetical protein
LKVACAWPAMHAVFQEFLMSLGPTLVRSCTWCKKKVKVEGGALLLDSYLFIIGIQNTLTLDRKRYCNHSLKRHIMDVTAKLSATWLYMSDLADFEQAVKVPKPQIYWERPHLIAFWGIGEIHRRPYLTVLVRAACPKEPRRPRMAPVIHGMRFLAASGSSPQKPRRYEGQNLTLNSAEPRRSGERHVSRGGR